MTAVLRRLRSAYGEPVQPPHGAPLDELVLTVLSQSTNDRNRDVAYQRLRERFPSWEAVRDAPLEQVEEAIRPGGISKVKSRRIQDILRSIDPLDLGWLENAPVGRARDYLVTLPGVGRKTAACVLLFSYGRHDVPVDTHVFRVGSRLGLFRAAGGLENAHDDILRLTTPEDAYEAHVALLRHGRRICSARAPACADCPLLDICPYGKAALA